MELSVSERRKNLALTAIQYIALLLFMAWPMFATEVLLLIIEVGGVMLGLWAIFTMRKSKLNITPQPAMGARLITNGPYRIIRHPMYAAILLTYLPVLISHFDYLRLLVFIVLIINLYFKLRFEESLLLRYFPDYQQYYRKTYRIIPYIF